MSNIDLPDKPHVLFINYYFPPMGGGGVQRIVKFMKYHDRSRFKATVLTVKPSFFYSEDSTLQQELPDDLEVIYSGSLDPFRLLKLLKRDGQISAPANESGGALRKIASWLFIPDSRILWLPFAVLAIWRQNKKEPIDLMVASLPPFTSGLIARVAARLFNIRYIIDYRDSWTDNPYLPSPGKIHARINEFLENSVIKRASGFIFVNPYLNRRYRRRYRVMSERPMVTLRNGFDPQDFSSVHSNISDGPFTLCIMGTVYSQGNQPTTLIKAIELLLDDDPDLARQFKLRIIGKWVPEFRELAEKSRAAGVIEWTSYLPHKIALQEASKAHALALTLESNLSGSSMVTPGRIYEYLRLKRPILAMCNQKGDLADLIRNSNSGVVFHSEDVESIAHQIKLWIHAPEEMQRFTYKGLDAFSRKNQAGELDDFICEILEA
ncbi:MAG: glycosyltransferase [Calditrichota bacterium]